MKFKFILIIVPLVLFSCATKISDLKTPMEEKFIVLDKNFLRIDTKENSNQAYVGGILAGTYKFVGSNKKGEYYLGDSPSVLNLMNADALEFIKTQKIPQAAYERNQYPRGVSNGGLLIESKDGKKSVHIFHLLDPVNSWQQGALVGGINNAIRGGLETWKYQIEDNILQEIESQLQ